jgi:hypothetical protein
VPNEVAKEGFVDLGVDDLASEEALRYLQQLGGSGVMSYRHTVPANKQ